MRACTSVHNTQNTLTHRKIHKKMLIHSKTTQEESQIAKQANIRNRYNCTYTLLYALHGQKK